MTALASNYRLYELPWTPNGEEERRFQRMLWIGLAIWLLVVVLSEVLPSAERPVAQPLPDAVVKLVLQPALPKPVEQKKPEPKPLVPPKPVPEIDKAELAKKKAAKEMKLVKDELADLRAALDPEKLASAKNLTNKVDEARAERSLITSNIGGGSGGINTAALSAGFGGGPGALHGHSTMQGVQSFADGMRRGAATRTGSSGKAARSREEIEMVFDRNKSAIYALYNRALRDNPQLQGKVVVQLTIAPTGEVTDCRILSSELKSDELERKLVARIKMFKFDDKDVELITTTKPIDFFPA